MRRVRRERDAGESWKVVERRGEGPSSTGTAMRARETRVIANVRRIHEFITDARRSIRFDSIRSFSPRSQQFGCPHSRNPKSSRAGTGGPPPNSTFTNLATGTTVTRDAREGCVPDEFIDKTSNDIGTLSMANTGQKNSGGSQFFVNTVHNDFLDHWRSDLSPSQHPVFGRVVDGMDVVKAIERVQTDGGDNPKTPVTMIKVSIA